MLMTLAEAAEQTGKSRSTLNRAIKSGKLSGHRNEHGDFRVDASELFRVFEPMTRHGEPNDSPTESQSEMVSDLLEMVKTKDAELADVRDELTDTKTRLREQRQAARALMSPESVEQQLSEQADRLKQQHNTAIESERSQQAKQLAEQKQQGVLQTEKWRRAMADRKLEIQQARTEADELRQREQEHEIALDAERARVAALESRGLIARLFNKKVEHVG